MKSRPILLVIITLLIGFILGWLTSAQVRIQKLKPVRMYYSGDRFREGFFNIIQPDEKQKAEIEKILDKYAGLNNDMQENFRKELDANMKAFRKELDSKLTKEQLSRLKEIDERRQEMIKHDRRSRNDSVSDRRFRTGDHPGESYHGDRRQGPPTSLPDPDSSSSFDSE